MGGLSAKKCHHSRLLRNNSAYSMSCTVVPHLSTACLMLSIQCCRGWSRGRVVCGVHFNQRCAVLPSVTLFMYPYQRSWDCSMESRIICTPSSCLWQLWSASTRHQVLVWCLHSTTYLFWWRLWSASTRHQVLVWCLHSTTYLFWWQLWSASTRHQVLVWCLPSTTYLFWWRLWSASTRHQVLVWCLHSTTYLFWWQLWSASTRLISWILMKVILYAKIISGSPISSELPNLVKASQTTAELLWCKDLSMAFQPWTLTSTSQN